MWPRDFAALAASFFDTDYSQGLAAMLALFVYYGVGIGLPALIGSVALAQREKRKRRRIGAIHSMAERVR